MSSSKQYILLKPVAMTKEIMLDLEKRNLIIRIAPGTHEPAAKAGETTCESIFEPEPQYGPHKMMAITVNRTTLPEFGSHPDNENFYLIGDTHTKPMYLVIALCLKDELDRKIAANELISADFITLKVKHNDPEVSFFIMLKDVPHGEATGKGEGKAASFFVTVSRDLPDVDTDFKNYELKINED